MYFQVHQPFRLGRYSCFEVGKQENYFDLLGNREILRRVAHKSYLPTIRRLRALENALGKQFAIALSLSGTVVEQLQEFAPEVLVEFQNLAQSPRVEILAETYNHSLSSLYSVDHFHKEVERHSNLMRDVFKVSPRVFRNTELIYCDEIGRAIYEMGFVGALVEEKAISNSPCSIVQHPDLQLPLLMRNRKLSDEIAFRFPLLKGSSCEARVDQYLAQVMAHSSRSLPVGVFIDFETFGEHHWEETGIFEFLERMPKIFVEQCGGRFLLPSEVFASHVPEAPLSVKHPYSWADTEKDLTAWLGNSMQRKAINEVYGLLDSCTEILKTSDDSKVPHQQLAQNLSYLLTSDHFYYMCTKRAGDGAVHAYFSPYESPYDAFIRYMNVLRDLRGRLDGYRLSRSMHHPTNAVQPV